MTGLPLTDGLAALGNADEELTTCACWRVKLGGYSLEPTLVVPFDTGLDEVESMARRALYESVARTADEEWRSKYAEAVATVRLEAIERQQDVQIHARLG
jgi:hypothetical protein